MNYEEHQPKNYQFYKHMASIRLESYTKLCHLVRVVGVDRDVPKKVITTQKGVKKTVFDWPVCIKEVLRRQFP